MALHFVNNDFLAKHNKYSDTPDAFLLAMLLKLTVAQVAVNTAPVQWRARSQ